jgi:large subunit ribosomal protein L23
MASSFIIKRPHITERATNLSGLRKYVFLVASNATKPEVKKAIKEIYKVDVIQVNVVNRPPKRKRFAGRMQGSQEGYRKAIVTLKEGQKIDIH